jgi:N-methylhydantoinase A/acetone carboxylase, beta subunit
VPGHHDRVTGGRRRIRIGVDTGGTFTDVVAVDEDSGELVALKTPSTPDDPAEAFLVGIRAALAAIDATPDDLVSVSHGTTVATNQLLTGDVSGLGFVTTEGFEHLLEIARQSVPDGYGNSYFWVKPPRIVPADLVRTVGGRLDHRGVEIRPFDEEGARQAAASLRRAGVRAVGVCFLHAYANPAHELRMRDVLAHEHPDAVVSLSHEVLAEYREYERAMTTLVDAAVKVRVAAYVSRLRRELTAFAGRPVPFHIMKSNGGVLSADEVVHQPVTTVLSGPAAGALGAAMVTRAAGYDHVLTLDGGGTSTDVSVVRHGEPALTTEGTIGGYPCTVPMIDIVTVGAGGGSIAWVSPEGTLKVGPRSAGADPGPICYGRGGTEPTVTDACLVLGRIPPHLLGGEVPLSVDAARDALARLGSALGLDPLAAAAGVLEISAWNQANALRQVTVHRGLDVRDFALATFGGSGSLPLCRLIDLVGVPVGLVPRDPGNLSAFGLLTVDVRVDHVRTHVSRHTTLDHAAVRSILDSLRARAAQALLAEGFPPEQHRFAASADLRYFGQAFEVRVPLADGPFDATTADAAVQAFHDAHERLYGYCFRDRPEQQVEWVNLRITGIGPIRRPALRPATRGQAVPTFQAEAVSPTGRRPVCFDVAEGLVDTPIYWRPDLPAGTVVEGPAVIEEYGATVPLHPGFTATVDDLGNLVVTRDVRKESLLGAGRQQGVLPDTTAGPDTAAGGGEP